MQRRLRGLLGMALVWGAGWSAFGVLFTLVQLGPMGMAGAPGPALAAVVQVALRWAVFAAVGGALFAAALRWRAGRAASVDALSASRAAGWGGATGLLFAAAFALSAGFPLAPALVFLGLAALLGAASGGTVALAQRPAARLAAARDANALALSGR